MLLNLSPVIAPAIIAVELQPPGRLRPQAAPPGVDAANPLCQYWHVEVKTLIWLGDSLANLKAFPAAVQDDMGFALYVAQAGETHHSAKPLHGLGSGVMEIAASDRSGTFRAVYTVSFQDSIYVLHAFQKKSKSGIATPKAEIDLVRRRLKQLKTEVRNATSETSR